MAPTMEASNMVDPAPMVKKGRGRPRKSQPQIDPSQPLHPWASTSKPVVPTTTSAGQAPHNPHQPPPQPQPSEFTLPPHPSILYPSVRATPAPAASFYAQNMHAGMDAQRATPAPHPMPFHQEQYLLPIPAQRKRLPTRADLDFLLGGRAAARARSSTPNAAAVLARNVPGPAATSSHFAGPARYESVAPAPYVNHPYARGQTPFAGPSRSAALSHSAVTASPYVPPAPATAAGSSAYLHGPSHPTPYSNADGPYGGPDYDDGLALGAEAVMESDHNGGSSSDADVEDETMLNDPDDPNDADFKPGGKSSSSKRPGRFSQHTRQSQASTSSAGKVPGSANRTRASSQNAPKRRGRPPKVEYTPEVLERIKAANEILAMGESAADQGIRLDSIIDRKTRRELSPEMRQVILRARNTQLQRLRRESMRANGGVVIPQINKRPTRLSKTSLAGSATNAESAAQAEPERERERGRRRRERAEDDAGSGSAIVERAKGKVSEWIKTISSDPEPTAEQHATPAENFAIDPALRDEGPGTQADAPPAIPNDAAPAIQNDADDAFARFATVTGKEAAPVTHGETDPQLTPHEDGQVADAAAPPAACQAGVPGDEYYFST